MNTVLKALVTGLGLSILASTSHANNIKDGGISRGMAKACVQKIKLTYLGRFESHYSFHRAWKNYDNDWWISVRLVQHKKLNNDDSTTVLRYEASCKMNDIDFTVISHTTPSLEEWPKD